MSENGSKPVDAWIKDIIEDFISGSPENNLQNQAKDKAFEDPLVGFSRGDDPLFEAYKNHVGPFHWTPWEIFNLTFPMLNVEPDALTVISWVLPQTKVTKADNRNEHFYPSERWARARIFGEMVNVKLRSHVVTALLQEGYSAVAPQLSPQWERKTSETYGFASTWSERHIGKAVRLGSVIACVRIPPTPRPYRDRHDYCIFFSKGLCGKCIPRCPVGAITEKGHDKVKCRNHIRPVTEEYVKAHYGFDGYGCGLCQTGVPCESKVPTKADV
jgi:epoxyqueuosine reductase